MNMNSNVVFLCLTLIIVEVVCQRHYYPNRPYYRPDLYRRMRKEPEVQGYGLYRPFTMQTLHSKQDPVPSTECKER